MTQEAGKLKLCDLKDAIALSQVRVPARACARRRGTRTLAQEQRKHDMSATQTRGTAHAQPFADEVRAHTHTCARTR